MPDGTQTVRRGRKFDQVVEGARQVFLSDGFERASVDDIARSAGVSKATLYSYFPDKKLLFVEVMKAECERLADSAMQDIDFGHPPKVVLTQVARTLVDVFLSEFGQQTFRMSIAESRNFDGLGPRYYECGPELIASILIGYFEKAEAKGELEIDDKELAAHQLCELCKAMVFPRKILHIEENVSDAQKARVVDGAVAMFLARYAV